MQWLNHAYLATDDDAHLSEFERLVDLARDALTRHLAHGEPITPVDPGHIKGSPLRHSAPLALPAPSPNSHATPHEDATRLK